MKTCVYNGDFADGTVGRHNIPFVRGVPVNLIDEEADALAKNCPQDWAIVGASKPPEILPVTPSIESASTSITPE